LHTLLVSLNNAFKDYVPVFPVLIDFCLTPLRLFISHAAGGPILRTEDCYELYACVQKTGSV